MINLIQMDIKRGGLLASLLLFLFFEASAEIQTVPVSELKPEDKHLRASELISHILTTYHYKKIALNDALSSSIYDHYLKLLDPNRVYFLATDIEEFEQYRHRIDDSIINSSLSPPFDIFKRYRQRVNERTNFALNAVQTDFKFDIDESYRFDRREDDWIATKLELDDLWRKRVKNDVLNLKLTGKKISTIKKTLSSRYKRIQSNTVQINSNDIFQSFINAYTTSIDPHTNYFSPRASENFDISMSLSLEGIGAVLSSENDYTQIVKVIKGGPADLSNQVKVDDRIISVGQANEAIVDVIGWRLDDVVDLIRGPKGTTIKLEILPKDIGAESPSKIVTLTRDKIKLEEQAASSKIIPVANSRIGVVELPTFYIDFAAKSQGKKNYKSTSRDIRALIDALIYENIDGLIIDLRGNGGGSLSEALELTGLFIDRGPVVQTKDMNGVIDVNYDPDPGIHYAGPLAVLVDRNSASASEIFAGAIQDYHRGIIIGEPTFGKGTVQNIIDLNQFIKENDEDHGRLKTTIAQFFRVNGNSNQFKGIIPDIIFPTVEDTKDHGERAYENALPWDKIAPARYNSASAPISSFKIVKKAHEERIKHDKLFQLLLKKIALKHKANNKKELSLLESKRKQEREILLATQKDIRNAMRAEKGLMPLTETEIEQGKNADDAEKEEPIDILLDETAIILNDLIKPTTKQKTDIRTVKLHEKAP